MSLLRSATIPAVLLGVSAAATSAPAAGVQLDTIKLPRGFKIEVYAGDVPGARSMALAPGGTLFVGTTRDGVVYAVTPAKDAPRGDKVRVIAKGLNVPNGVAVRDGALYVAEVNRVSRFDDIESRLDNPPAPVVVNDSFPSDRHHGWKFIRFGPDGLLYVPVGAPCNVCERERPEYASITRMKPDGSAREVFANGVRNSVGFDWHPGTRELWFTDNGRDMLGDDRPPDEFNRAPKPGMHFGFPYCFGKDISDPEFGRQRPCAELTPATVELGPHVAALGLRFYTGTMFPAEYRNQVFIAEHGSWNRTTPIGARVTLVRQEPDGTFKYQVFAEGWQNAQGQRWGRPVDVQVMPDGALLVSDDTAGAIYRITYRVSQ